MSMNSMNRSLLRSAYTVLFLFVLSIAAASAQEMMIASGAGYSKPVTEVMQSFKKETGITVNATFANLQAASSQAKQTGEISCIIGDKKFLEGVSSTVNFVKYQPLGKGVLVLAYRKGITLAKPEEIATDRVKTLFLPHQKNAIYGIAGAEALNAYGLSASLAGKITQVGTVPQVVSYLMTGEADAGFINLTEALANKEKLGGYLIIPEEKYTPILIVAGLVKGFEGNPQTIKFLQYLQTKDAKLIFDKYGVK